MNETYRLTKQTSAITTGSRHRTLVSIQAGSSITVLGPSPTDDRFAEIIWEKHHLQIFAVELQEAGDPITVRRFNAAGREK